MPTTWAILIVVLWAVVLLEMALLLALYRQVGIVYLGQAPARARDGLPLLALSPRWHGRDHRGNDISSDMFSGRPLLLVFADPNCGPCQTLMPDLHDFATAHADDVGVVVAASADERANRQMAERYFLDVPVVGQENRVLADRFRVTVTPFMFLIDDEGRIRDKGIVNGRGQLEEKLAKLKPQVLEGVT